MRPPTGLGRRMMLAAFLAWASCLAGWVGGTPALVLGGVAAAAIAATGRWIVVALVLSALVSGWAAAARVAATLTAVVPDGPVVLLGRVADEPSLVAGGVRFVFAPDRREVAGRWQAAGLPPIGVTASGDQPTITAGDRVIVRGVLTSAPGRIRGDPVAGRVRRASLELISRSSKPLFSVGNALRSRVGDRLADRDENAEAAALLRGFLIGDTNAVDTRDIEALRRSGLSHFVAVSGSNVALFLAGWWIVTAPIATRPRVRFALGLVGLVVFVIVTRWEPSVVRAATMAGLVLGSRLVGTPIDGWTALGAAATALLLISGDLAGSVGFQLSVFATAGVLVGARMFSGRRPRWAWTALAATVSAQAAVTPLLLFHFGSVPLLSPVANLVAAPLVTVATVLGGIGVLVGSEALLGPGLVAARSVLSIARLAAGWPQLGVVGMGVTAAITAALRWRPVRPLAVASGATVALVLITSGSGVDEATVTFLDVGQGDAVLLHDESGVVVLVDGGGDPRILDIALRRHGVTGINLLVVTHGDADHVGGLDGIVGRRSIGRIWVPDQPDLGDILGDLLRHAESLGVPVERVRSGARMTLGPFALSTLGPIRRYASDNDGSIVLWVEVGDATVMLPGDVEAVAQRELPSIRPDVLLVPHHGSATTDLAWLEATLASYAVISVGQNSYGHPAAGVLGTIARSGAELQQTRDVGDVSIALR